MRLPRQRLIRSGASAVEAAIILTAFLTLVLGVLDLGIGVLRYHMACDAARIGARQAIVHGSMADKLGSWDSGSAASNITSSVASFLKAGGVTSGNYTVNVSYPDGNNNPNNPPAGSRVKVTVTIPYQPVMTFIFGAPTINLTGSSQMYIAH
jgi:Flp pilus assembly protein TadG